MRLLLDECVPRPLKRLIVGHQVFTVRDMRWQGLKNGELLAMVEQHFDVFLTVDRNMEYQQNWAARQIAVIVLSAPNTALPTLRPLVPQVLAALEDIQPGAFIRIEVQPRIED